MTFPKDASQLSLLSVGWENLPQLGFPQKTCFQVLYSQSFKQDSLLFMMIDEAGSQRLIHSSFIPCNRNCLAVHSFTSCPLV